MWKFKEDLVPKKSNENYVLLIGKSCLHTPKKIQSHHFLINTYFKLWAQLAQYIMVYLYVCQLPLQHLTVAVDTLFAHFFRQLYTAIWH